VAVTRFHGAGELLDAPGERVRLPRNASFDSRACAGLFVINIREIEQWTDTDRVHRLITQEIPAKVAADTAYQNAQKNSDKQNARIEHDRALGRVMTGVLKDDTQLYALFADNESFRKWLTEWVFGLTYGRQAQEKQT